MIIILVYNSQRIIRNERIERTNAMADLNGTKTHHNLKDAFAGESQANRRYLYFAKQADVEGYSDIAGLFRDTAEGETGHAHGHRTTSSRSAIRPPTPQSAPPTRI